MSAEAFVETVREQTDVERVFTYPGSPARHIYAALKQTDVELIQGVREKHLLHLAQTRYYRELARGDKEIPVVVVSASMGESMVFQPLIAGSITAPCLIVIAESRYQHLDDANHVYHQTDRGRSTEDLPEADVLHDHENVAGRLFISDTSDYADLGPFVQRIREHRQVGIVHLPTYAYAEERVDLAAATRPRPTELSVEDLRRRFSSAERPMLVVGRGARSPDTLATIEDVAARSGAVVGTTLHMDGFIETHHVGRVGMLGSPAANEAMFQADLIVAVGSSVHAALTSMDPDTIQSLRPKLVQVEASPDHRSRFVGAYLDTAPTAAMTVMASNGCGDVWFIPESYGDERFHETLPDRVRELGELLRHHRPEAVVTLGVGNATVWLAYALGPRMKKEVSRSGSMGELAGALNRHPEPIIVMGDGELEMDLSLLLEAVNQESGATIFILNNGRLGMVTEKQEAEFGDVLTPKRCPVDYDALGDAIDGLRSFAASGTEPFASTVRDALSYDGTAVVEVPVEQRLSPDLFNLERLPRFR